MSSLTYYYYLAVLTLLAPAATVASAAVAPTPRGPATAAQFLSAINAARADAKVPQLSWNATVAQDAKLRLTWLRTSAGCDLHKKDQSPFPLKVSMTFFTSGGGPRPVPADVVAFWLVERQWYDRGADACVAGQECGNYKIVVNPVWRQLGCAVVACPSGRVAAACGYSSGAK